ncbi:hypothetical protein AGMMS49974_06340 [Deltaproteobacteria bacterium]|nr:hypothetical protein AGMMS49974_06340 [Deltaproteobacteria bacterium]
MDFEPWGGNQPENWKNKSLYDYATFINGAAFKKDQYSPSKNGLPIVKIAELKNGITETTEYCAVQKEQKYYIFDKDILFSWSGNPETSIDTFIWHHGNAILNQHTFKVIPNSSHYSFIYCLLRYMKPEFTRIASNKQTTGLWHVTVADLKRLQFPYSDETIFEFCQNADPIIYQIYNNLFENSRLAALRDSLLPKLMSGELSVANL